jgi:hypothetical protein
VRLTQNKNLWGVSLTSQSSFLDCCFPEKHGTIDA